MLIQTSFVYQIFRGLNNSKKIALVFFYTKDRRASYNVLIGTLDQFNLSSELDIILANGDKIIKEKLYQEFITFLQDLITKRNYEKLIFAISFFTTELFQLLNLFKLLSKLKDTLGNSIFLVAGGPHPSGDPVGTLLLGFDLVFIGESEESFLGFIREFIDNDSFEIEDLRRVKGIAFIDHYDKKIVYTGKQKPISLDDYPPFAPNRGLFNAIEITRGCPFGCWFCQTTYIFGAKIRHRSIDNVLDWVHLLLKNNRRDIRFISPNALAYGSKDGLSPDYSNVNALVTGVYELVKKYDGRLFFGSFPSEIWPQFVNQEIMNFLKKYVSNKRIIIGAQSGSQKILRLIHRRHSVTDVLNAVKSILSAGFNAEVDFIFGLPNETEEDIKETINFVYILVELGAIIHAHMFIPLPGTPLSDSVPIKLPSKFKRKLIKLIGYKKLYGDWIRQEKDSQKILQLISAGIIKTKEIVYTLLNKGYIPIR